MTKEQRLWVGVISRTHVLRGVAGGFTQVCHGKRAPLARMKPGDLFFVYSPTTEMRGGEVLRAFTAVGVIRDDVVFQFDMGGGFVPFRRAVNWQPRVNEVPLNSLRSRLQFVKDAGWGLKARSGHFEISRADGAVLLDAMGDGLDGLRAHLGV
ncbi:MAG: EVE domain-containing protein [Archangium sp.]|nr:EVE domain-containing protein [Archangium sp.]